MTRRMLLGLERRTAVPGCTAPAATAAHPAIPGSGATHRCQRLVATGDLEHPRVHGLDDHSVRVTRDQLAGALDGADMWANALKPGGVDAFEVAISAATLTSPEEGLDKNMHKALQVNEHPDIVFRLLRLEPGSGAGAVRGVGVLRIAGVEREVTLDITAERKGSTLCVHGQVRLLMTDFGIKPPTAMLGMLKTS